MADLASERDLGPYHGQYEAMARFMSRLALSIVVAILLLHWGTVLFIAVWKHYTLSQALSVLGDLKLFNLALYSFLVVTGCCSAARLYGLLSCRIQAGGQDAEFLDRVRQQLASLFMLAAVLFLWLLMPSGLVGSR